MDKKTALVLGAGGFIGSHMVKRLRSEGYWVRGVDIKYPDFSMSAADDFVRGDLREVGLVARVLEVEGEAFDEIYQFAADMGGAGYIFTDEHSADIMHNSASINLNVLNEQVALNRLLDVNKTKIFYSSSACMYPEHNQLVSRQFLIVVKTLPTQPIQTLSMDGRNYFQRDCILHMLATTTLTFLWLVIITFLDQKEHGMEERKRLPPQSAVRYHYSQMWVERLRCGVMDCRQDPSSSLMSVLKQLVG